MAILHYQRLGKFSVNIDDGFPLSEDTDDSDSEDQQNIDALVTDEDQEEVDPDSDEPDDEDTLSV